MIFWLAQPQDYTQYKFGTTVPYDGGVWAIIQTILNRLKNDDYQQCSIHYNPQEDIPTRVTRKLTNK